LTHARKIIAPAPRQKVFAENLKIAAAWPDHVRERRRAVRQTKINDVSQLCEFIFHRRGQQVGRFNKAWASACDTAGVPGKLFHDLRRFTVRSLTRANVPQSVAMKISGHRTASMFQRYNIIDTADVRTALEQTEKFRKAQAATPPQVVRMGERG
jgi:integrase